MATSPPSSNPSRSPGRTEAELCSLLSAVNQARAEFRAHRDQANRRENRADQVVRADRLADAMEAYADTAAAAGIPLPYRYRDELRLYRAMARHDVDDGRTR